MIRALIWKEWRTHWPMLTLFLLLGFIAFFLPMKMATAYNWNWYGLDKLMVAALVMAAWIHGQLIGALLTGDDREEGTAFYLDCLTANRKVRARLLFLLSLLFQLPFIFSLLLAGYLAGIFATEEPFLLGLNLSLGSFLGLGWGLAMGLRTPSVLGGFGLSAAIQASAYLVMWGFFTFLNAFINLDPEFATFLVFLLTLVLIIVPWVLAWLWFTGEERARVGALTGMERAAPWWKSGLWLCWPRIWKNFVWQAPLAILLSLVIGKNPLMWPAWSLFLGVFWGAIIIAPEQKDGFRWWGMMRPPLLRFWGVPALLCFFTGIFLLAMTFIFHLFFLIVTREARFEGVYAIYEAGGWPGLGYLIPLGPWLVNWFAPGFASAVFFSPWMRKPVVGLILAYAIGVFLSLSWIPSLLAGSAGIFTVLAPSLILLAGGIAWVRPWVNGTLKSRETKIKAVAVFAFAFLFAPAILLSRALARLPDSSSLGLEELKKQISLQVKTGEFLAAEARILKAKDLTRDPLWEWVKHAGLNGWKSMGKILGEARANVKVGDKDKPPQLKDILAYLQTHHERLHPDKMPFTPVPTPASFVQWDYPDLNREYGFYYGAQHLFEFENAFALYQAGQGNEQALVDTLAWELSVARCYYHLTPSPYLFFGTGLENVAYRLVFLYIQDFKGTEETLEKLALVVRQHNAQKEKIVPPNLEGLGCLYGLNALDHPQALLKKKLSVNEMIWGSLVAEAWQVPWEKKRFQREILEWFLHPDKRKVEASSQGYNKFEVPVEFFTRSKHSFDNYLGENREMRVLVESGLALRRYRLANGSWPTDWQQLQGKYLDKVPMDPWGNEPLRFRVSNGEVHKRWAEPITLAPDTLVLWSIGKDLVDNRGEFKPYKDEEEEGPSTPIGPGNLTPPSARDKLISSREIIFYYEKDIILIIPP